MRLALACLLLVGCSRPRARARRGAPPPSPPEAAPAPPALRGDSVEALTVPGYGDAVAVVPRGDGPWPVVLAAHANYDRPEYHCAVWRPVVDGRAFVLCPRGVAQPRMSPRDEARFTFPSVAALRRELDAALAALRAAHGTRVARGPVVYAGFSLGAILAAAYVTGAPERVAAAVLVEGGHTLWTDRVARAFAAQGGRAVVFACGQASCARDAREAAGRLRAAGVDAEVAVAPGAGHVFQGRVARALGPAFERTIAPLLVAR